MAQKNAYITDDKGNKYDSEGNVVVTEAEINQARNDMIPGTINSDATVITNSQYAGYSAGGTGSTGSTGSTVGTGSNSGIENQLGKSDQLYQDALAADKEVNNLKNQLNGDRKTGSGLEAALGKDINYSWNQQGTDKANTRLQMDVNSAKQEALAQRQTIEQNALAYQEQADMMKYSANQSAQSAGWTGGYVLDQNRQMEYLKASIQSQMYGAMELQKYGYDTALAAARLSYDLNQQEFAHQYYMDAVTVALQEAETTGVYISAEVRDMLAQHSTAELIINSTDATADEKDRAHQVKNAVNDWFRENGLSETGVKTQATIFQEINVALQQSQLNWQNYYEQLTLEQSAKSAALSQLKSSSDFILYDKDGKPIMTGGSIEVYNWNNLSAEKKLEYINMSENNKQEYIGYVEGLVQGMLIAFKNYVGKQKPTADLWKAWLDKNQDLAKRELNVLGDNKLAKELYNEVYCTEEVNGVIVIYSKDGVTLSAATAPEPTSTDNKKEEKENNTGQPNTYLAASVGMSKEALAALNPNMA